MCWIVDGPLGENSCRDTLGYGAGDMVTLLFCAGVGTLGDGTGGGTLRDGVDSGIVKGAKFEDFLDVGGEIEGNCSIGRHS